MLSVCVLLIMAGGSLMLQPMIGIPVLAFVIAITVMGCGVLAKMTKYPLAQKQFFTSILIDITGFACLTSIIFIRGADGLYQLIDLLLIAIACVLLFMAFRIWKRVQNGTLPERYTFMPGLEDAKNMISKTKLRLDQNDTDKE